MRVLVLNPLSRSTKNIVRDLIYGCWCKGKRIGGAKAPPLSLLYVATVLKEDGFDIGFADAMAEQKESFNIKDYDFVIISTSTMSFNEDAQYLGELKKENPRLKTIVFGSHPTFMPEYCLSKKSVDFIVRKEPEFIIRDLLRSIKKKRDLTKVKGIGYREGKRVRINEFYPFIKNLDELPIPDRSLLPKDVDYFNPIIKRMPYTTAMTSRGCPGVCTFCNVPDFYGGSFRSRSAESVIEEIKQIVGMGYREIWFRDETFTVYKKRNNAIYDYIIKNNIDVTWICNARVGTVNKEEMKIMKKAGCHMIKFGVESGVQRILDNVKKNIDVRETKKVFKNANEVGVDTHAHVMLGMPGETRETIKATINFIKEINPTTATFGICTPYAGTPLFKDVSKKDSSIKDGSSIDLKKLHTTGYFNKYFTELTPEELERYVRLAYRKFYFRPSYVLKWLTKLDSMDQFKRVLLAGTNVFSFSIGQ
ncbi:B12-binding domain-containing radical SAM protein [Candidatus Woesearchaeota archaeon RBG_13_36_6]|nr:MAG: B12-binding domain-containing radical SAM protein [Candidatus Woesearchaeota archaeon RBG_13_36_6]